MNEIIIRVVNVHCFNYIGFSPGEGNQVSVLFVFSYG